MEIIKNIEKHKCLKRSGNLFILNRIDQTTQNGEEEIINSFKQYFYQNFEDDKNKERVEININENKFVPMNSLLYLAETKVNEDFCSMLIVELFRFIETNDKANLSSFYEYLEKIIEFNLKLINEQNKTINLDVKSIKKEELEIIEKSVDEINKIKKHSKREFSVEIKLKKKEIKNNMIKLFLIHKNKCYFYVHSKYYDELQQIMKEININDNNDLSSPPIQMSNIIMNLNAPKIENNNININNSEPKEFDESLTLKINNQSNNQFNRSIFNWSEIDKLSETINISAIPNENEKIALIILPPKQDENNINSNKIKKKRSDKRKSTDRNLNYKLSNLDFGAISEENDDDYSNEKNSNLNTSLNKRKISDINYNDINKLKTSKRMSFEIITKENVENNIDNEDLYLNLKPKYSNKKKRIFQ